MPLNNSTKPRILEGTTLLPILLSALRLQCSTAYLLYGLRILLLATGFGAVGWFLAATHANGITWLSFYGLIVYLVNTQQGGLFLAHGWVIAAMAFGAINRIWPSPWAAHIPYDHPRLWAFILLLIWGVAVALIHLLASAPGSTRKVLRQFPFSSSHSVATLLLIGWVGVAIALGGLSYQIGGGL